MILNDIGLIAADTSRTRAYLQALIRNDLIPSYVLVLESRELLPGQIKKSATPDPIIETDLNWSEVNFDPDLSIRTLIEKYNIPYQVADSSNINEPSIIKLIASRTESVFIFSGFGGVLLKSDILATNKKFLHVHGGYLPDYKGSTTNYYSLIDENTMGASAIFLTKEIDSGPILKRMKFSPPKHRLQIDHFYDSAARAKVLVDVLQEYIVKGEWEYEVPDNDGGETYYIIHPVLKHIAILDEA